MSYSSRFLFYLLGYNELLVKKKLSKAIEIKLNNEMVEVIDRYASCCKQKQIKLVFVLRCEKLELHDHHYELDLATMRAAITEKHQLQLIDLLPSYQKYFASTGEKMESYYWKMDTTMRKDIN
jgi:hypothetical protein